MQPQFHTPATQRERLAKEISKEALTTDQIEQMFTLLEKFRSENASSLTALDAHEAKAQETVVFPKSESVIIYGADAYRSMGVSLQAVIPDAPQNLLELCQLSPVASMIMWDQGLSLLEITQISSSWPITISEKIDQTKTVEPGWKLVPMASCTAPETDKRGVAEALKVVSQALPEHILVSAADPRMLALAAIMHFNVTKERLLCHQPTVTAWENVIFIANEGGIFINDFAEHNLSRDGMAGVRLAPVIGRKEF